MKTSPLCDIIHFMKNKIFTDIAIKADQRLRDSNEKWTIDDFTEVFGEMIVQHCSECIRDVLREEDSGLNYEVAEDIQKRIHEFFKLQW